MSLSTAEYVYLALIELDWAYRFVDLFMFGSLYNPACYHVCLNLPPLHTCYIPPCCDGLPQGPGPSSPDRGGHLG